MSVLSWKLQGNIKLEIPVFVEFLFQFYIIQRLTDKSGNKNKFGTFVFCIGIMFIFVLVIIHQKPNNNGTIQLDYTRHGEVNLLNHTFSSHDD
jgi:hypothetical protein